MTVYTDGYGGDKTTYNDVSVLAADPDAAGTYGTSTSVYWSEWNADQARAILKFDFSGLPANAIVSAVDFYYYLTATGSGTATTAHINRILAANSNWTEAGACWNYRVGSTAWAGSAGCSTAGTDYASAALWGPARPPYTLNAYNTVTLDLTEFALMWANNYGMVFSYPTEANYRTFASSDTVDTAKRPYLTVTYTLPAVPLATKMALLGVGI
jgi:hypothetical protein